MAPGESRSQGSQNGFCTWRQNEESVTEHQGSRNESFGELEWPLSTCSGMLTLGSGTGSQNGFHIMVRRLTQGVLRLYSGSAQALLRLCSGLLRLCSGILTLGSGQSSSCSRPQTKTEPAKGKINPESWGIASQNRPRLRKSLRRSRSHA